MKLLVAFKSCLLFLFLVLANHAVVAQSYAGPDKAKCKDGEGVQIGGPSKGAGYCYSWKPTTGLSDPESPNPTANPTTTTTYTVTVTGPDLSFTQTDDVEVSVVEIKNITFDVQKLVADGEHKATPPSVITPSSRKAKWSIKGNDLECTINESTGVITAGTELGTITVRVEDSEIEDCYKEASLELIDPVKDVTATDINTDDEGESHTGRVARKGQTLYLIASNMWGHSSVEIEAIPVRSSFTSKAPKWSGTGINPPDGTVSFKKSFAFEKAEYKAGETSTVYVERIPKQTRELSFPGVDVLQFVERNFQIKGAAGSFDFNINLGNAKYVNETAEKCNDPGWDWKEEVSGGMTAGANVKILHPGLSRDLSVFGNDVAKVEVGVALNGEVALAMKGSKDPGECDDLTWKFDQASLEGQVLAEVYALIYVNVGSVKGQGEVNGNTTIKGALRTKDGKTVDYKWGWGGINAAVIINVEWIKDPNDGVYSLLEYKEEVTLVDGYESNWNQLFPR